MFNFINSEILCTTDEWGIKVDVHTLDLHGLLSNMNMVLRENSLSLHGERYGCPHFCITDAMSSTIDANNIDQQRLEVAHNEIARGIFNERKNDCSIAHRLLKDGIYFLCFIL
ncbi:hypothetical protein IEQ34_020370 [Dendrobium chrysotoxum]|uniref:Uncharacterized protein n=1 Tax=Dendrobium chrysotoxum TaxID=161865 RepID=A0AAV7G1U3_DENCH|nr:hypothetical protein IEQ34_020370 [Dendrobium chrysotoxum]